MTRLVLLWLINATAVYGTSAVLDGIEVESYWSALAVAFVMGLINTVIRPIIVLFTMPLIIISLGLILVIINGALLYFATYIIEGFRVDGFWTACFGSLMISVISILLAWILGVGKAEKKSE